MNAVRPQAAVETPPPLVRVSGLSASFGPAPALAQLDLTIEPGELVAVTGEPGAGKTTLVRLLAGDIAPTEGEIVVGGRPMIAGPDAADRHGVAVVWQDLALCENLDVAGNLMLGREGRRLMLSESRFHAAASSLLESLRIPIRDTTLLVGSLSGAQRQLLAMAKAMSRDPRLLVLDEPTASLGVIEAVQVEELIASARARGATVLLASRDIEQMFRLADRIVVLRHGRVVAELDPRGTHPDDVAALLSGQEVDLSARRQLTRLHGLTDRLVSADPSSSLSLILSALGAALGTEKVCIHVVSGRALVCTASLGFEPEQIAPLARLSLGPGGGPAGQAAERAERVIVEDLSAGGFWAPFDQLAASAEVSSCWSIPVSGHDGVGAVITVFPTEPAQPERDELDLLSLYAGYASSAVERERLLDQVTARNRVLETIREMLQTLAGPIAVEEGLSVALGSLRRGLQADEVGLVTRSEGQLVVCRAYAGALGTAPGLISPGLSALAEQALDETRRHGKAQGFGGGQHPEVLAVPFNAPAGPTVLVASWPSPRQSEEETALIEDAAHSLRLALEREEAGLAHQEAAALRRSRELQRGFLSRLSHELRTPLTAIRGYASSLMQPDVTWDGDSQERFLERIAAESARLGRLVDDLLDFSAIESGVMRLQRDWCDIPLVLEAAASCLPAAWSAAISIAPDAALPPVWADHDRLEQVFVNLLSNAFRHNPPGTRVDIEARSLHTPTPEIEIIVRDDGAGFAAELGPSPLESPRRHRSPSSGAGLGLSIARGIVDAHEGSIGLMASARGAAFRICLPVEGGGGQGTAGVADPAESDAELSARV